MRFDLGQTPVVKILFPYAGGLATGLLSLWPLSGSTLIIGGGILWVVLVFSYHLYRRKPVAGSLLCGAATFLLCFISGTGTGGKSRPVDPSLPSGEYVVVAGRISEGPAERNGRYLFDMDVVLVSWGEYAVNSKTMIKVYLNPHPHNMLPAEGEMWLLTGRLSEIRNHGNPGEPDYASVMQRRGFWYRLYCDTIPGINRRMRVNPRRIPDASSIRKSVSVMWNGPSKRASLLKAICLGDRSGLPATLLEAYADAGGMHLLAVSGLHVGLIWWVLNKASFFLVRIFRKEYIRLIAVTALLWFYAYLTGFSASVCRSVTMFTFLSAGKVMSYRGNAVNSTLVSALFLLLIRPGMLLQVGFQLSYMAVLSIVSLQPSLTRIIKPANPLLKWIWEATSVSIAAQAGTFPLVVYYFGQLPAYALLTNLLAVPMLSCIICLFMISVPMVVLGIHWGAVTATMQFMAGAMNGTMEIVGSMPGAVIGNLRIDRVELSLMMTLVMLVLYFRHAGVRTLGSALVVFALLLCYSTGTVLMRNRTSQIVVGHFTDGSMVTFREGALVDCYIWAYNEEQVEWMERSVEKAWGKRCYKVTVLRCILVPEAGTRIHPAGQIRYTGSATASAPIMPGVWITGNRNQLGLVLTGNAEKIPAIQNLTPEPGFLVVSGEPGSFFLPGGTIFSEVPEIILDGSNGSWYARRLTGRYPRIHHTAVNGAWIHSY